MTIKNQISFFLSKKGIFLFVCEAGKKPVGAKKGVWKECFGGSGRNPEKVKKKKKRGFRKKLR